MDFFCNLDRKLCTPNTETAKTRFRVLRANVNRMAARTLVEYRIDETLPYVDEDVLNLLIHAGRGLPVPPDVPEVAALLREPSFQALVDHLDLVEVYARRAARGDFGHAFAPRPPERSAATGLFALAAGAITVIGIAAVILTRPRT